MATQEPNSRRISIEVEIDTDPVPGWGYDPEDFVKLIKRKLNESIPHYNPSVKLSESQEKHTV